MVRKDGTVFPVRLRGAAQRDETGAIIASSAAIEDLTDQRLLEKRVLQAQKLESLGLMAGGIAHDFNNLLVSIMGNAELALKRLSDQPDAVGNVTDIVIAARRAADLCRQLLAYAGKSRIEDAEIDVAELVRELTQVLEVSVGRDALIKLDLDDACRTTGDATQLRQVLMNLVINAGEALEGTRGLISISSRVRTLTEDEIVQSTNVGVRPGHYVCVEVADTGCGIGPDIRDRIFDPFFTTKETGHGLGLAAVHGIVRAHHGTITITTSVRGTSVRVFLPALPRNDAPPSAAVSLRHKTVLVVDDNRNVLETLMRLLDSSGYTVLTASSGAEALLIARARGDEIDAYLVDVSMPQVSGPELFHLIRADLPDAIVVLMSGFDDSETVRRVTKHGLAGFLQKPFLLESFEELLDAAFSAR
jgi:signal transduction histidine kinase/CheY-like chemotaxis protein